MVATNLFRYLRGGVGLIMVLDITIHYDSLAVYIMHNPRLIQTGDNYYYSAVPGCVSSY